MDDVFIKSIMPIQGSKINYHYDGKKTLLRARSEG